MKKRVALGGRGKSGGVRALLAFKLNDIAFFMYGFAKNQWSNISDKDLKALKLLAAKPLACDCRQQAIAIAAQDYSATQIKGIRLRIKASKAVFDVF